MALLKFFFLSSLNLDSVYILIVFWLSVALITIACVRRVGVMNYLEAMLIMGFWLFFSLLIENITLAVLLGNDIYREPALWISYLVMILSIFLFHKKRHVEIRKIQAANAPAKHH